MPAESDVTFSTFLVSLASAALAPQGPSASGAPVRDPGLARDTLEVLTLLAHKTKGNLTDAEGKLLAALQAELRSALQG